MIALYLLLLLTWTLICVQAGQLYEAYRLRREDLIQREAWAERYQHDHKGAA